MKGCDGDGGKDDDSYTKQCLNIHRGNFKIHHQSPPPPPSLSILIQCTLHTCTPAYYSLLKEAATEFVGVGTACGIYLPFSGPESLNEINDVSKNIFVRTVEKLKQQQRKKTFSIWSLDKPLGSERGRRHATHTQTHPDHENGMKIELQFEKAEHFSYL